MSVSPKLSIFYDNFRSFHAYNFDFWLRHQYDMLDQTPYMKELVHNYATEYLDKHVWNPKTVREELQKQQKIVHDAGSEMFTGVDEPAYFRRQRHLFLYKILWDMYNEVFKFSTQLLDSVRTVPIDRDGDHFMYLEDVHGEPRSILSEPQSPRRA